MDHLISIDEENRIRALPAEKFKESELLLKASTEFRNKSNDLQMVSDGLVDVLNLQWNTVESIKLKAIGYRMKAEMEPEERRKAEHHFSRLIKEKESELRRLEIQLESLERIERDQLAMIEKLSSHDGLI